MEVVAERTLVILKPDAVARGLCGEIITRLERVGLKIVAAKMVSVNEDLARQHYLVDRTDWVRGLGEKTLTSYARRQDRSVAADFGTEDPFKIGQQVAQYLVSYLQTRPVLVLVLEGNLAVEVVRKLVGNTLPALAEPGTIRGDYGNDSPEVANPARRALYTLIHASGNREEAAYEINLWFTPEEIHDYARADEATIFGPSC